MGLVMRVTASTLICFPARHSLWWVCVSTSFNHQAFVSNDSPHLWDTWSRVWQCATLGCHQGYDKWLHRSLGNLLLLRSRAFHLEREERGIRDKKSATVPVMGRTNTNTTRGMATHKNYPHLTHAHTRTLRNANSIRNENDLSPSASIGWLHWKL
jgi:hypothetical protein